MSNIKRVGIVIAVAIAAVVVMVSFKGSDVLDRSIILGLGVDSDGEGGVRLTAEVVSPGNGQEQVGTFSKTVSANGRAVGQAIQNIAEKTGKEASLGQCVVIVFGQAYYENTDFSDSINYFINHHSLKESVVVCCCDGDAERLLNQGNAMSQSVSMSIATTLLEQATSVAVMNNDLLDYARSQRELDQSGFMNILHFEASPNKDPQQPEQTQGYFTYREVAVFRGNRYVCRLNEQETMGMSLFFREVAGESFVSDAAALRYTVQVNDNSVDKRLMGELVQLDVRLTVRLARTDSKEIDGFFAVENDGDLTDDVLKDVERQAAALAQLFLSKQAEYNFDLVGFHELFRRKQGLSDELRALPMSAIPYTLSVTVEES